MEEEKRIDSTNKMDKQKQAKEEPAVCRADGMDYVRASTFRVELKEEDRIKIAGPHKGFGGR